MEEDDIVIIGMSCRIAKAKSPDEFWNLLKQGENSITEVPMQRWDVNEIYSENKELPGKSISKWGSFVKDIDKFDNEFFNISKEEAERIDPQQRIILELVWEAMEDSGIIFDDLYGSETGVYMGVSHSDYERLSYKDIDGIVGHDGTGLYHSLVANRVSYFFNLKGPSMVTDSACSSSISALHTAISALKLDEVEIAIVGGITLNLAPEETIGLSKANLLSPEGKCFTFSEKANGFVRGEGGGVIFLTKKSYTIEKQYSPIARVVSIGINQDGKSNGLLAPNGGMQVKLYKKCLSKVNVDPKNISLIEAHGTGTYVGDLIELRAIGQIYGRSTEYYPCYISSAKTNIGHLEAASGIISIIKVILCLKNKSIPKHLNCTNLNKRIDLNKIGLVIPKKLTKWNFVKHRIVAVNAFGFGGTNGHVILDEVKTTQELNYNTEKKAKKEYFIFIISAHNRQALSQKLKNCHEWLINHSNVNLEVLSFNMNVRTSHFFKNSIFIIASDYAKLLEKIFQCCLDMEKNEKDIHMIISSTLNSVIDNIELTSTIFKKVIKRIYFNGEAILDQNYWESLTYQQKRIITGLIFYESLNQLKEENNSNGKIILKDETEVYNALKNSFIHFKHEYHIEQKNKHIFKANSMDLHIEKYFFQLIEKLIKDGNKINISKLYKNISYPLIKLPNYPFQRKSFWANIPYE